MNPDLQTLQQFFPKLNRFSATIQSEKIESDQASCKKIFNKIIEIQIDVEKHQRENATNFNVFNILCYGHYETRLHTPFLFSLLHPEGAHQLSFGFIVIVLKNQSKRNSFKTFESSKNMPPRFMVELIFF